MAVINITAKEQNETPRVVILQEDENWSITDTISGIHGIAKTLHMEMAHELKQDACLLASALAVLTEKLYRASGNVPCELESKVRKALTAPDTGAEVLSKKLGERGLALLEHTAMPGSYAVLEPRQGTLEMQMNSIEGIEEWLERERGGAS